jgi:hypothetical protein
VSALPSMSSRMARIDDATPATEAGFPQSTRCNSCDAPLRGLDIATVFGDAVTRAGLSHKEAAALMKLDRAHWSRQLNSADGQHISVQRLFEHMPRAFWLELLQRIAEPLGVVIARPDPSAATLARALALTTEIARELLEQQAMRRAG